MALTQESVLSFLLERGGKAKNSELLNNFRRQISSSDPAEKQHNRDLFKKLVNSVAVVKQIDGVKFVVVKKRYQDFAKEAAHDASRKTHMDDSFMGSNTILPCTSPPGAASAKMIYYDIQNNNICSSSSMEDIRPLPRDVTADTTAVRVLNLSGDRGSRVRKPGAMFAVIAVKSPPATQGGSHSQVEQNTTEDKSAKVAPSVPIQNFPVYEKGAQSDSKCWKNRQPEEMHPAGFPQMGPQNKTTRQGDDAKYSECVPLEPLAHMWLVKCAAGLWGQIYSLLLQDTRLAQKKDFMSGFTALHWAAKDGNRKIIQKLMDISRKTGTYVNVNSKAHGGYTPLHIAAIHGHAEVMVLLVQSYGASVRERDNDGKKALYYLGKGVPDEVRALLGDVQHSKDVEKTEDEEYREHSKGFNTISKLFQPHTGKRRAMKKFVHDSLE